VTAPDHLAACLVTDCAGRDMIDRQPLVVELLATEDARRLATATDAARPIGADRFAYEPQRRITVADHERWKQTGEPPHKDDADLAGFISELRNLKPETP
jgi:hypothetical protein